MSRPYVQISRSALRHNIETMRARLDEGVAVGAVVKSDAYGHGAVEVARMAEQLGCAFLIVGHVGEGLQLREADLTAPVLIIAPSYGDEAETIVRAGFSATVGDIEMMVRLSDEAVRQGQSARIHLKIDTGMGRWGFLESDVTAALDRARALPGLTIEGLCTHLSEGDVPDSEFTDKQLRRFERVIALAASRGVAPPYVHFANSGAMTFHPSQPGCNLARLGLAMYGSPPAPVAADELALQPVMSAFAEVAEVRNVPAGWPIGYGRTFHTPRPSRLAVVPFGYAHGCPRRASGEAAVLVDGQRAHVVGRIAMSIAVVDVTDLPQARVGSRVLLFGRDGDAVLPVEEWARAAQTIPYEVYCNVGAHLERRYV